MAGLVGINVSQVEQLSAALGTASDNITATLEELDRQLGTLSQQWSGGAAEAYEQASTQAAAALKQLNAILRQVEQATITIADRHREAETEVQQLWA